MAEKPATAHLHSPSECFQLDTLKEIQYSLKGVLPTLKRLEDQGERSARALEQIAAQGAVLEAHEKRIDEHSKAINIAFQRLSENHTAVMGKVDLLAERVEPLILRHAQEDGEKKVLQEVKREEQVEYEAKVSLVNGIKVQLVTPVLVGSFFILWLADKIGFFQWILDRIHEFKG